MNKIVIGILITLCIVMIGCNKPIIQDTRGVTLTEAIGTENGTLFNGLTCDGYVYSDRCYSRCSESSTFIEGRCLTQEQIKQYDLEVNGTK